MPNFERDYREALVAPLVNRVTDIITARDLLPDPLVHVHRKDRNVERLEQQLVAANNFLSAASTELAYSIRHLATAQQKNEDLRREVATHRAWNKAVNAALEQSERENADMRAMLPETPDYHGPTKDGKAVADPVHERVHEVVKDVLAGRVIPAARKQLQGALDKAPKDAAAGPDFTRDFGKDPRRLGMA